MRFLLSVVLVLALPFLIWGEGPTLPKYTPSSVRAPDLDFANDPEWDAVSDRRPRQVREESSSRPWVYWGLGLTVVGGGITYLILDQHTPAPIRTVQTFTDKPN